MPKREKKRWMTANQIRDAIEAYKAKAAEQMDTAEALEKSARELLKVPRLVEDGKFKMEMAHKARVKARRIHEVKLPQLKQKLAEWSTELLPGVIPDNDRSIQR